MDFKPTKRQREFMGDPGRFTLIPARHSNGRRHAMELQITAEALDAREAELAIKDLHESGIALLSNGRRVDPHARRPRAKIEFDELPSEPAP